MGRVETLEESVRALSDEELAAFRAWFVSIDAEAWRHHTMGVAGDLEVPRLSREDLITHTRVIGHGGRLMPVAQDPA
jgi:hypothetical protein